MTIQTLPETEFAVIETIVTIAIVLAALVWFFTWFRGTARGEKGCSCGGCTKECGSRTMAPNGDEAAQS